MRTTLPETGYLRLSQIIGNPKADPPNHPGFKEHLVGRGQVRPLPAARQKIRTKNYRVESFRYKGNDRRATGIRGGL